MTRALILMYHVVDEPRSPREARFCVRPADFARQMASLRSLGYRPVALEEIVDGTAGPDAVAVTFDDGFEATCENAPAVLRACDIPATLFAVSQRLGRDNDWMHSRGLPRRPLASASRLRGLARAGVAIGSHSRTHPRLTELAPAELQREVAQSRDELEDLLGQAVRTFAYPYGAYDGRVRDAVQAAGYRAACSTRPGFNREAEDRFALRRIDVFGGDALWQVKQKLRFGTNEATRGFPLRYYAGRVAARLGWRTA